MDVEGSLCCPVVDGPANEERLYLRIAGIRLEILQVLQRNRHLKRHLVFLNHCCHFVDRSRPVAEVEIHFFTGWVRLFAMCRREVRYSGQIKAIASDAGLSPKLIHNLR